MATQQVRYIIVPIFYKQTALEQLGTLLFGGTPVGEEPLDLSYVGAICDDKDTAERLVAAVIDEKEKWMGHIKRYEIMPWTGVYPDDEKKPLPDFLYLEKDSVNVEPRPRFFTPDRVKDISPKLVEMGLVKIRKNLYYNEGLSNGGTYYVAPYFNSSTPSNVASTSSKEIAGPEVELS